MSINALAASVFAALLGSSATAYQPPSTQPPPKPEFVIPRPDGAAAPARPEQPPAGSYVIGPQDTLAITVLDEQDLTGKFRVDTDGTITYPYLNRIRVTGLTIDQLRSRVVEGLQNGFLKNPQVRIEIDQFKARSVMVMGAVRTPSKVPLTGVTMSLLEALALAGSPSASASNEVRVQRQGKPGEKQPDPIIVNRRDLESGRTDLQVQDGDIINVPEAQKFYIQGEVRNTGQLIYDSGMTVGQALILAGGVTDRGSDRRITIERTVNGKLTKIDSVKLTDKVLPGDIISVGRRLF